MNNESFRVTRFLNMEVISFRRHGRVIFTRMMNTLVVIVLGRKCCIRIVPS